MNRDRKQAGGFNAVQIVVRILETAKRHWLAILFACLVGLVVGVTYLNVAQKQYTATMIVGPVSADSSSPLAMLNNSPLASFTRNPFSQDVTPFDKFRQMLFSSDTGAALLQQPDVVDNVYKGMWDPEKKAWRQPNAGAVSVSGLVKDLLARPGWHPPSPDGMKAFVIANVKMASMDTNGLYSMTFTSSSPEFAQSFLWTLYRTTDNVLRARELQRTQSYIAYLNEQLKNVTNADERQALINLLTRQEQTLMLSSAGQPYSAVVLDSPQLPWRPTSPKVLYGVIVFPFLFGLLALFGLHFMPITVKQKIFRFDRSRIAAHRQEIA
ncbi:MAG: Wzz/FepE/Etk N-terminal domain-containing protein [Rhizomicrobium sp.]